MHHTLMNSLVKTLWVFVLACVCTACEMPDTALGPAPQERGAQDQAVALDADALERIAAQGRLDELRLHIASLRMRLPQLPAPQRDAMALELNALEALWREAQRQLVELGWDAAAPVPGNPILSATPAPTTTTLEPLPWKKSG